MMDDQLVGQISRPETEEPLTPYGEWAVVLTRATAGASETEVIVLAGAGVHACIPDTGEAEVGQA